MKLLTNKKFIIAILITLLLIAAFLGIWLPARSAGYDYSHLVKTNAYDAGEPLKSIGSSDISGMIKVSENNLLELYYNKKTAEVAVKDKRSNKIWYTNPQERDTDSLANKTEKEKMSSQLTISYINTLLQEHVLSSYVDSVKKSQFDAYSIKDGIRVTYTMGEVDSPGSRLPVYITLERFNEKIASKLSEADANFFRQRYGNSVKNKGFLELRTAILTSPVLLNRALKLLDEAGYTAEDLAYDNEQSGYVTEDVKPFVKIALEYTLNNDKLIVRIPVNKIENEKSMKITGIEILNYFGAGSDKETGYIFVPSGSGGLINFNNGKQKDDVYVQQVYGSDPVMTPKSLIQYSQTVRLPIFGVKSGEDAFLASIEDGQAIATITADVSGRNNSYNTVFSKYLIRSDEALNMSGLSGTESDLKIVEKNGYIGDISIIYCFMPSAQADYTGMANYYQNYLIEKGMLTKSPRKEKPDFYLDILGSVQKKEITMGVPYQSVIALTTYNQANEILDLLESEGISSVQMRYQGWFNRGVNHDVAKGINLDGVVGSKKQLIQLDERLKEQNGGLYPDVGFSLVPKNTKNYSSTYEVSRQIGGQSIISAPYNPAKLTMSSPYINAISYVNSPNALPKQMDKFINEYQKLSLNNISLKDLGDILSSDKNSKRQVDRENSRLITEEQMSRLANITGGMMVSGGNQYSFKYADYIENAPTSVDKFDIIDEEIPFYEIVVRSCLGYTGTAINTVEIFNEQNELLRMVEYGTAPHFALSYAESAELSKTVLEDYFSTYYLDWIDIAAKFYETASEVQSKVYDANIIEHIIHENGIREIKYDNGVSIYVNYSDQDLSIGNINIKAKSYVIKG